MRVTLHLFFPAVILITSTLSAVAGDPAPIPDQQQWYEIPVAPGGQLILLPVTLAGQSFKCLCSSSDDHSFDETLRPILGSVIGTKELMGLDGNVTRKDIVTTPVLNLSGYEVRPGDGEYSFVLDLASIRQVFEEDIRGVLGVSVLRGRLVQFDFDNGAVRLSRGQVNLDTLGTPWPLRSTDRGELWVDNLQVGDRTESFQILLGHNRCVLVHDWLFKALKSEGTLKEFDPDRSRSIRLFDSWTGSGGLLSRMSWGQFTQSEIRIDTAASNGLGLGFLSRFVITIDAAGGRIYLLPGKKAKSNRPDAHPSLGLTLDKTGHVFMVTDVRDHSPASEGGVLVGDSITSMNHVSCHDMSIMEFAWRIDESRGSRLKLTLNRQGTLIDVSFDMPLTSDPEVFVQEGEQAVPAK